MISWWSKKGIGPATTTALILAIGIAGFPSTARAYVDPGAGSLLLQGALGVFAAGLAVASMYWRRVRSFLAKYRAAGRHGGE